MTILYNDEDKRLTPEILGLMQKAADIAFASEMGDTEIPVDLSVTVVDYEEIRELNNEYRGIDKATDVLSFPQFADRDDLREEIESYEIVDVDEDDEFDMGVMLGDVVICYDRALEQAEEYGTGIRRELVYLFVHSIFHLMGYDHEQDDEKKIMRAKEEAVLEAINISR